MAEEALKKLEEQLNCSICLDTYTDPKLLQCFHVYCRQCLVPLVVQDQRGHLGLTCPTCRQVTPVSDRGVAGLSPAFHINHLLEIQESFQKLENQIPVAESTSTSEFRKCFEHIGEEVELYCETCGELVCLQCVIRGKHQNHDYDDVNEAFKKYKGDITSSLNPMEMQIVTVKKALVQLDARCNEISDQHAATGDSIHATFRQLKEVLNVRETKLISQLDRVTQGKLKGLAAQRDRIETTLAHLSSCVYYMKESLLSGNEGDVLMMKANTMEQIKELTTPFQVDIFKPNAVADVFFMAPADVTAMCQNYELVLTPQGSLQSHTMAEEPSDGVDQVVNKPPQCEASAKSGLGRRGQHLCHQPTINRRLQQINNQQIKSSAKNLVTPTVSIDGVLGPCGVAINHDKEEVVIAEWNGYCVSVFSIGGEKLRSFGTRGSEQGQFLGPRGVAVDREGNILVTNYWNNRIQKFTAEGRFLSAVGTKGCGPLQFSYPTGVAYNASNDKVYVMDWANHRVEILNSDLTFFSTFGQEGSGKAQFSYPCGITFDKAGKVYVADSANHRIQVFTAEGEFVTMFGCYEGLEELHYPNCLAIDARDMVYVGEGNSYRVSAFTLEGHLVTLFGRRGEGPGEFDWPCGLAVDNHGAVYVCDFSNDRVQIFS